MDEQIRQAALEYHRLPKPGKISIAPTKALTNQQDLSMAYSPGVAAACDAIVEDPAEAVHACVVDLECHFCFSLFIGLRS